MISSMKFKISSLIKNPGLVDYNWQTFLSLKHYPHNHCSFDQYILESRALFYTHQLANLSSDFLGGFLSYFVADSFLKTQSISIGFKKLFPTLKARYCMLSQHCLLFVLLVGCFLYQKMWFTDLHRVFLIFIINLRSPYGCLTS